MSKYKLIWRVFGNLLVENPSLKANGVFKLMQNMLQNGLPAYAQTYQKELIEANITSAYLASKIVSQKLTGIDTLSSFHIAPHVAIVMVEQNSFAQVQKFGGYYGDWKRFLGDLITPKMIEHIRGELICSDLINILQQQPATIFVDEADVIKIKKLAHEMFINIKGISPASLVQIIFDDAFIKSSYKAALSELDYRADQVIVDELTQHTSDMATPVTQSISEITIQSLNIIYNKSFAGHSWQPTQLCRPPALANQTNSYSTLSGYNSDTFENSTVQAGMLSLGVAFGFVAVPAAVNFARRQVLKLFWSKPQHGVTKTAEEEMSLLAEYRP